MFTIELSKENFKFSGTHFTIFSPKASERMHGHNYYVSLRLSLSDLDKNLGMAVDFNVIKPLVKAICQDLDEYVLIPEKSPFLKVNRLKNSIEIVFNNKRYELPEEDVKLLPLVNITSEELAKLFAELLKDQLPSSIPWIKLSLTIEETRGQAVSYKIKRI